MVDISDHSWDADTGSDGHSGHGDQAETDAQIYPGAGADTLSRGETQETPADTAPCPVQESGIEIWTLKCM